jgi:hypothetical protein
VLSRCGFLCSDIWVLHVCRQCATAGGATPWGPWSTRKPCRRAPAQAPCRCLLASCSPRMTRTLRTRAVCSSTLAAKPATCCSVPAQLARRPHAGNRQSRNCDGRLATAERPARGDLIGGTDGSNIIDESNRGLVWFQRRCWLELTVSLAQSLCPSRSSAGCCKGLLNLQHTTVLGAAHTAGCKSAHPLAAG